MKLYKYQGISNFERDLNFLNENKFWCSKIEDLNDPSEALFNIDNFKKNLNISLKLLDFIKIKDYKKENVENLINSYEKIINLFKKYGIYSLSKNPINELMWAHYSSKHQGFCIEYEIKDLKKFDITLPSKEKYLENSCAMFDIKYSKNILNIDSSIINQSNRYLLNKLLGQKSSSWIYEEEVRIVTMLHGEHLYEENCLKSVTFGFCLKEDNKIKLYNLLSPKEIEFYQMNRKENSYTLYREKLKL